MRFTIKQMMAWTVVVAVILGTLFGLPDVVALPLTALFIMTMPVVLIVGTIYARNWKRTFFIGALIATGPLLMLVTFYGPMLLMGISMQVDFDLSELDEATLISKCYAVGLAVFAGLNGAIALGVRWLVSDETQTSPTPVTNSQPIADSSVVNRLNTVPVPYAVMEGRVTVEST